MKGWQWLLIIALGALALGGGYVAIGGLTGVIQKFAEAIANAEGFYVAGSLAQRQNNPGNIKDASGNIGTYATAADGWAALTNQVSLMFNGGSAYYSPTMSIMQIGMIYADGDPNWGTNVAAYLGVSPTATLDSLGGSANA